MQTEPPIHRSPDIGQPIFGVLDQRAPREGKTARAPIGLAFASGFWLQPLQLPPMPLQRGETEQAHVLWCACPANDGIGQYPRIHTMGAERLSQFLLAFLETQAIAQVFGFPALPRLGGRYLS